MTTKTQRDLLAWGALAAALAVTASAEYSLARACGFGSVVAAGVPAALDIYAVRALRAGRDVVAVVVAMIAVNALAHLVSAGQLSTSVPLVVAVSAIAPLVLWRVHRLGHERPQQSEVDGTEDSDGVTPFTPASEQVDGDTEPLPSPAAVLEPVTANPLVTPEEREVDTPTAPQCEVNATEGSGGGRLSAWEAKNQIRAAWVMGKSVTEAAELSTRSRSYAHKVYAELDTQSATEPAQLTPMPA